ncbi:MAG: glycosyltransferase [Geobacteraceae bacterium]|nr:glycosyltransferase [Geobacteraceae bacterium]
MIEFPLDIILPVWNRPVDVRAALASFVSDSPMARIIMVNNGSERETESILDEFAEALDDRALLVATARNIGTIAALNLGFSKSTAPLMLVASPFTRLSAGWFESVAAHLANRPDTGSLKIAKAITSTSSPSIESDHGSFDSMIIRNTLYSAIGGFDENMDGSLWALRDFARRSLTKGFLTESLFSRNLTLLDYRELGSDSKRKERIFSARECYMLRWGGQRTFLLNCGDFLFGTDASSLKNALLQTARHGDRVVLTAENSIARELKSYGFAGMHENVSFQPLPRFFSQRALARIIESTLALDAAAFLISDSPEFEAGLQKLSFEDFLAMTDKRNELYC